MYKKLLTMAFLSFIVTGLKAQTNRKNANSDIKKWNFMVEAGIVRPGFKDSYFYSDFNHSQISRVKILEGTGFKANIDYGVNFAKRYNIATSIGVYNYSTVTDNITTIPLALHFKINYFKNKTNTPFIRGNMGYSLPFRKTAQGFNYGYNLGYQFYAVKNEKHLLNISLQNQTQNLIGTYIENGGTTQADGSVIPYTHILTGNYKLKTWTLNLGYAF